MTYIDLFPYLLFSKVSRHYQKNYIKNKINIF